MNLQQRKKELEAELAKINEELSRKPTPEQRFWGILRSINRPFLPKGKWLLKEIFFFRDNDYIISYDREKNILWCSRKNLWSVFKKEFGMKDGDIQRMIKVEIEKTFKINGVVSVRRNQRAEP